MRERNYRIYRILLLTSFIIWSHLSPTWERTCLAMSIEAHTGTPPAADWKRPPGRPRRTWLQQVEEDIGLSVGAAQIASRDRSMWRTLYDLDLQLVKRSSQWVSVWFPAVVRRYIWLTLRRLVTFLFSGTVYKLSYLLTYLLTYLLIY